MQPYNPVLKHNARQLRRNMTDAEQKLWFRLRRKQIHGVQFYRQKPVGPYIADFHAVAARLVIELDGSQHQMPDGLAADHDRDAYMASQGLLVLRFDNLQVLQQLDEVLARIDEVVRERLKSPPAPLLQRGERGE
jgi:very-short-patch-repair endonuclease